jgi:hypothetical protein
VKWKVAVKAKREAAASEEDMDGLKRLLHEYNT